MMGGSTRPSESVLRRGPTRVQVKTGCRTCKIRKVKCDEARPACRRCVSTGRICDGYGIWGDGMHSHIGKNKSFSLTHRSSIKVSSLQLATLPTFPGTHEERESLEWFRCRTSKKIPGAFFSALWDPLLYAACMNEPVILHAIISLSSIHRREVCPSSYEVAYDTVDTEELFALQHYSQAIHHLQPPFTIKDKASARAALMACFVFVCLELLRGHIATGQTHLENGLRLLRQLNVTISETDGVTIFKTAPGSVDEAIVKAFCRLDLQSKLYTCNIQQPRQVLRGSDYPSSSQSFRSVDDAWKKIEEIYGKVFHLAELARRHQESSHSTVRQSSSLLSYQHEIQAESTRCFNTLRDSHSSMEGRDSLGLAYGLLCTYQSMAAIMADTCLYAGDESEFGSQSLRFLFILNKSIMMWKARNPGRPKSLPWPYFHMSRSIVDIGWIAPLYYTALKCRIHRIRLQAIRLLEISSHREGMWDSTTAACVARRVMEIEEDGCYQDMHVADDFSLSSSPEAQDLSLPTPPQINMIREVYLPLADRQDTPLILFYKQGQKGWESTAIWMRSQDESDLIHALR